MFVADKSSGLPVIQDYLHGYYVALDMHGIVETSARLTHAHFSTWLRLRGYKEFALGWAWVLQQAHGDAAFDKFFELLDRYRNVSPTVVATVRLTDEQRQHGERAVDAMAGPMQQPDRIEIVQYAPDPVHIVRIHCGTRSIEHVLYAPPLAAPATTIDHAFSWVAERFGVDRAQWSAA